MIHQQADEFTGFDDARRIMWCHGVRARVLERLEVTSFLADPEILAVHVDNTSRADRVFLAAFDADGQLKGNDTLYIDEPGQRLDIAPEFDHDYTGMNVATGSELNAAIDRECGWVVNMQALRAYDLIADRRATQRAVLLAHLPDLMKRGEARGFLFGSSDTNSAGLA